MSRFGCSCCAGRKIASGSGGDGVCVCLYVNLCVHVFEYGHMGIPEWSNQRTTLSAFLSLSTLFWGMGSLTEPSIHRLAGLAGSPAPGILLFLPPIVMICTSHIQCPSF